MPPGLSGILARADGLDPPTTVNQIDWFVKNIGAERFGLGTAQVLSPGDDDDLLLRFSLANAYDIAEIDLFDYETSGELPRYRWHLGCILRKMPAIVVGRATVRQPVQHLEHHRAVL